MELLGGVIFENLLFHLGGDIKISSLICSITFLFHRFEMKRGTVFRSADVNFSALVWSVVPPLPPRYLACLYAQLGYLHRLFCKLGVKGVNTKVFTIFTPFTLNVSVNGVNSENCVYLS